MTEASYTAWDDNLYEWPPPDGWYEADDGKWWPQGFGPQGSDGPAELADVDFPDGGPSPNGSEASHQLVDVPQSEAAPSERATAETELDDPVATPSDSDGNRHDGDDEDDGGDDELPSIDDLLPPIDDVFGGKDPFADDDGDDDPGARRRSLSAEELDGDRLLDELLGGRADDEEGDVDDGPAADHGTDLDPGNDLDEGASADDGTDLDGGSATDLDDGPTIDDGTDLDGGSATGLDGESAADDGTGTDLDGGSAAAHAHGPDEAGSAADDGTAGRTGRDTDDDGAVGEASVEDAARVDGGAASVESEPDGLDDGVAYHDADADAGRDDGSPDTDPESRFDPGYDDESPGADPDPRFDDEVAYDDESPVVDPDPDSHFDDDLDEYGYDDESPSSASSPPPVPSTDRAPGENGATGGRSGASSPPSVVSGFHLGELPSDHRPRPAEARAAEVRSPTAPRVRRKRPIDEVPRHTRSPVVTEHDVPPVRSEAPGVSPTERQRRAASGDAAPEDGRPRARRWPLVVVLLALVAIGVTTLVVFITGGEEDEGLDFASVLEQTGQGSFNEPYAFGTGSVVFYNDTATGEERRWVVQVVEPIVDDTRSLVDERGATPPPDDLVLAVARVRVAYQAGPTPGVPADLELSAIGPDQVLLAPDQCSTEVTEPLDTQVELAPGQALEGELCWQLPPSELDSMRLAVQAAPVDGAVFLALQ